MFNFVRLCDKELVKPLALSAVHCMGEVQLDSKVVESDHKYKHNARIEVMNVYIIIDETEKS